MESTKPKQASLVRYSLSTKTSDYLCSGKPIIAYGNKESGAIRFMRDTGSAPTATSYKELVDLLSKIKFGEIDYSPYSKSA